MPRLGLLGCLKVSTRAVLWLSLCHLQQRRDVVHHRLHAGSDRLKTGQPQQVHRCCSQRGPHPSAIPVPVQASQMC